MDQIPEHLQLTGDPLSHEVVHPYADYFYQTQINPQIKAAEAAVAKNGGSYGSYGGARIGQIQAQGELEKYQAGLAAAQQVFNNKIAGRQSYWQGAPRVVQEQNALDVQRGIGVAGLQSQNYDSQNDFNMGIFGIESNNNNSHNDFNRGIYDTQTDYAIAQNQQRQQNAGGWGEAIGNLFV